MTKEPSAQTKIDPLDARARAPQPPAPPRPFGRALANRFRRMFPNANQHRVHFVYMAPSDKEDRIATVAPMILKAALDMQEWYRTQMGGKTFTLAEPVVQICQSQYPANWFPTYNSGGDQRWWYWNNALGQLSQLAGGGFYQEFNDWIMYLDAEPDPGQGAGGTSAGTYSGVCVLGQRDINALLGQDAWTPCREEGGLDHEGGHSLGLAHPPPGDPNWGTAVMGVGYGIYPNCILTDADKEWLNGSPFFTPRPRGIVSNICPFASLGSRPNPTPRPRPTPRP